MQGHAHLLAGLAVGWLTAPLIGWLAARRRRSPAPPAPPAPDADAGARTAPAASSPPPPRATAAAAARPPAPIKQHPSLEHALAGAGAGEPPPCPHFPNGNNSNNNNGNNGNNNANAAADAAALPPTPPSLDFSSPQALAALFGGDALLPLRVAHDGRPLVAFDLEATGLSVTRDRVVEIAAVKVFPDGSVETKRHLVNPGSVAAARMPSAVVDIHGLTPSLLARQPRWEDVADEWRDFLRGCDLCGYNALRYDVPLLRAEFKRSGHSNFPPHGVRVLDGFRVFSRMAPRSLPAAVRVFCGGAAMAGHHSALADAAAALAVLRGQLSAYPGLPRDAGELAQWCASPDDPGRQLTWCGRITWDDGVSPLAVEAAAEAEAAAAGPYPALPPPLEATAVFSFGKYRDVPLIVVAEEDPEYLLWLVARREALSEEAAAIVAAALRGDFPRKGAGFAAWLARAMERLAPAAEGNLGVGGGGGDNEDAAPHPGGTEGAAVARWTGAAATAGAAAGATAGAAAAAGGGEDDAAGPSSSSPLPPPLSRLGPSGGIPATVCHLPGDFEREAPAAGAHGFGFGRSGGHRDHDRHRRPRRRFGGGGGDDDDTYPAVRNVGVQMPEPGVRGWEAAREAYLGGGVQEEKGLKAAQAAAAEAPGPGGGAAAVDPAAAAAAAAAAAGPSDFAAQKEGDDKADEVEAPPIDKPAAAAAASPSPPTPSPPAPAAPPLPPAFSANGGGGDSWGSPSPRASRSDQAAAVAAADAGVPAVPAPPPAAALPAAPAPALPFSLAAPPAAPALESASLDWGRYKGRPLSQVAAEDPTYLHWVIESLGASTWDRYMATAALREAGEPPPPPSDDGGGADGDDDEEVEEKGDAETAQDEAEADADAEEAAQEVEQRQAAASE